jgi:hypothetical protein
MTIEVNPTPAEIAELHDDLKAYEQTLANYLASPAGQADPNYVQLAKADISLNVQIFNLATAGLQIAAANAGAAVDAMNAAVAQLNAVVAAKAKIATDLAGVQSVVTFVLALLSRNPSTIINAGGAMVTALKAI